MEVTLLKNLLFASFLLMGSAFSTSEPISSCFKATPTTTTTQIMSSINTNALENGVSAVPPPIVYTIAGSDSGGGAGIQADLHTIHAMNCHGCSAITCLTAQSSTGVTGVHSPPVEFLRLQLETLLKDMPPRAIKVGMLGSKELALEVGQFLKQVKSSNEGEGEGPIVVFDPVMISTSGHKLIQDDAKAAIIESVFPYADILTPNKFEAEELLGRTLETPEDVEQGARDILDMGVRAVLIKGGHSLAETSSHTINQNVDVNATIGYAQDYFLSRDGPLTEGEERLCDGCRGVWIRSNRYDTSDTHGTGCTLSSAIASAMAIGHQQRSLSGNNAATGAGQAVEMIDACCLGKAYVTAGIGQGKQLGKGAGPVVHTSFPHNHVHFPTVSLKPKEGKPPAFLPMHSHRSTDKEGVELGPLLPIVGDFDWVERLCRVKGVKDIQLRIKGETDGEKIESLVAQCQKACEEAGVRLWINDFWRAAVKAKCFGIHMGQEDLARCADEGGLEIIQRKGIALGISTHSYAELAAALGVRPSYISLGPIFGTKSKNVAFEPQGLATLFKWRQLINPAIPLVAIGGINDEKISASVREHGCDCVAVISAVTKAKDVDFAVQEIEKSMKL